MRHSSLAWRCLGAIVAAAAALTVLCLVAAAQAPPPEPGPQDPLNPPAYNPDEDLKRQKEMQALAGEFQKFLEEHGDVVRTNPDDFALAQLQVEKCALLAGRYVPGESRDAQFKKAYDQARALLAALAAGRKAVYPATGLVERAYYSEIDRSTQPYYLYVPEKLDPAKPAPLLVWLHGYIGNLDKVNWLDQTMSDSVKTAADRLGAVMLAPFARSNTDFEGIGERDVLQTIELARRLYRIDADRVWLTGCSMGASGVWCIAAHYPDLFAAAVPASGRNDYNLWMNVPRGTLAEFKQFIVDRDFAVALTPNFRSLPVFAFHGEDDWLVQPEQSRAMVKALQGSAFEAILHEFPHGDHWTCFQAFESDLLFGWLPSKKLPNRPLRVTYRTYHPRFNRAYWVSIDDFTEFGKPAEVDVTMLAPTLVSVKSQNVARLTLDLRGGFFLPDQAQALLSDGKLLKPVAVRDGRATFRLADVPEGGLRKRAELCGPVYEAYQTPFLIVYGSAGDPEAQTASKKAVAGAFLEWWEFAAGIPRVKKDADVTDEDIRQFNLIVFGTPATNVFLKRIADRLPVKIEDGRFTVGKSTYEGANLGLSLVYPNPLNPAKYVVVWSGTTWGPGLSKNHKLDLVPDYIVFDDTVSPVSGTNNFKVAGFFDINWKLDEKLMWFGPEKAPPLAPEPPPPLAPLTPKDPATP